MRFLGYPIYKILAAFILGLLLQRYINCSITVAIYVVGLALIAIVSCYLKLFTYPVKRAVFFAGILVFFVAFAAVNAGLRIPQHQPNHYVNLPYEQGRFLEINLLTELPSNGFSKRFYAGVQQLDDKQVTGKILFQSPLTDSLELAPGYSLHLATAIAPIAVEKNPSDFKYNEYLAGIAVYGRVYGNKEQLLKLVDKRNEATGFTAFKQVLTQRLKASSLMGQPRAFVEALLLGNRENIDPEVNNSFRDAGVIHILALSGLHVGIILLILSFFTKWLHRYKYGRFMQSALLVCLLWMFGILTGLSPSIMRAVTMFSFVAIAMNINRSTSVLHSLALSAFVLLVANPNLLFQVGFQLSYVAVIAIVVIQPIIASLWRPTWWAPKYMWNVFTVTLAAQIGVAPISLFYFNQFPGLFLLGNLLLLPAMPLILGACLLFIFLILVQAPHNWLAQPLNSVFHFYIDAITRISEVRSFIITDVYLTLTELFLIYGILISATLFFLKVVRKSRLERVQLLKPNYGLHAALALLAILLVVKGWQHNPKDAQLIVLHQSIGTAITIIENKEALVLADLHVMDREGIAKSKKRLLSSTLFKNKIVKQDSVKNLIKWNNQTLVVIGKNGFYDTAQKNATILLSHSPLVNLNRLIDDLQPKKIIADGSNFKQSIAAWEKTCAQRNVPFVNTYEFGAVRVGE